MHSKNLFRIIFIVWITVLSVATAQAQKSAAIEEPDEYGFPTITCGFSWATHEYLSRSGEKIVVTEQFYKSPGLVDEAIEERVKSAEKIIERKSVLGIKGESQGLRVVALFADKVITLERKGKWLFSIEASSLEGLLKFEAYRNKYQKR